jgi:hypothetical protein
LSAFVFAILIGLLPALAQPAADAEYVLRNNTLRCVRAPCPTVDATEVATGQLTRVAGIDIAAVAIDDERRGALMADLRAGCFVVAGRIERTGDRGAVFFVSRVVRRAPGGPPPRTKLP